jgi:hypothetical protein
MVRSRRIPGGQVKQVVLPSFAKQAQWVLLALAALQGSAKEVARPANDFGRAQDSNRAMMPSESIRP